MKKWLGFLWLIPALAPAAVMAVPEDAYWAAMPAVLTASRLLQSPLDAPAPVMVIDRETIQASGLTELHDLLRLAPGFQVADWPRGGAMVSNHGLGDALSRRLLILVDGSSVLDSALGNVHWEDLPVHIEDVERVEVVRGPNQASYGAKAYQGVVNIITRRAGEDAGGQVVLAAGERDYGNLYARIGGYGERLDWRLGVSGRQATQFRDLARDDHQYGERISRRTLNAQFVYRSALDTEWRGTLGYSGAEDKVGSTLDGDAYPDHERRNQNLFAQLNWRRVYAPGSEWSVQYAHFARQEREGYPYVYTPLSTPVDYDIDTWRDDLEFQQIHAFSDHVTGLWGGSLRRDQAESDRYLSGLGRDTATQWQLFGNLDWRFRQDWLLHAGGMLEKYDHTDALFSPRLAINFFPKPNQSVRISAGRGYRTPSLLEADAREVFVYRGADFLSLSNGDIVDVGIWSDTLVKPEKLDFFELGYTGRFPDRRLNLDVRAYVEWHDNFIDTTVCYMPPTLDSPACTFTPPSGYFPLQQWFGSDDKVYVFANLGKNRVQGAEMSIDWQHPDWGRFRVGYSVTQVDSDVSDAGVRADAERSAPSHAASLLWSGEFGQGLQASLGAYHVGDMKWLGGGDDQPSYTRWDLRLAKRLNHSEDEVALVVRNLNGSHIEYRDNATVERQAFVTLRLGW